MSIRVISGRARGRRLKLVPGETTRPIMDRIKENLFNLIRPDYIADQRWLDLFGGTGSVGIEALSRGAKHVMFVDAARTAVRTINANLESTDLADSATVRHVDAYQFLETNSEPFDVIFIAPPQYHGLWVGALTGLEENLDNLLVQDGLVIVQIDPKEHMALNLRYLEVTKDRTYGNTQLIFYQRRLPDDE